MSLAGTQQPVSSCSLVCRESGVKQTRNLSAGRGRDRPPLTPKRACLGATHTNAFMSLNFRSWHKGTGTGPRQESGEQQECYPDINRNIGNIKDPNEPDLRRVE